MARNTEPRLAAAEGASEEQRTALAVFLDTLSRHASETAAILASYKSTAEIIADSTDEDKISGDKPDGHILRSVGPLFATEVDLDSDPDHETVVAMRYEITQASRHNASSDRRRVIRMATFAGEVAAWAAQQELSSSNALEPPGNHQAASEGGTPPTLTAQWSDPVGLPETA